MSRGTTFSTRLHVAQRKFRIKCADVEYSLRLKTLWILGDPQSALQYTNTLDCTYTQADFSLRVTHMKHCRKCCDPARQIYPYRQRL